MKSQIGIIGAGRLGTAVARLAVRAGYTVRIANSKKPASLELILDVLLPGARAATLPELVAASDIILLAIPLPKYRELSPELFTGKIVIDAMNYWPPTQGHLSDFDASTSSEVVARYFAGSSLVKALSSVAYHELEEHSLPAGNPNRRAIVMAGDNAAAKLEVAAFINKLGFDPVDLGDLARGAAFQPGTKLFDHRYTATSLPQ